MPTEARFVRLQVMESLFQAQRAETILEEADIECMTVSYHDTALDGLYQAVKGWGEIRVRGRDRKRAARILQEQLAKEGKVTDDELTRQAIEAERDPETRPSQKSPIAGMLAVVACLVILGTVVALRQLRDRPGWLGSLSDYEWAVAGVLAVYGVLIAYLFHRVGQRNR